jgi:hypothetical protein
MSITIYYVFPFFFLNKAINHRTHREHPVGTAVFRLLP